MCDYLDNVQQKAYIVPSMQMYKLTYWYIVKSAHADSSCFSYIKLSNVHVGTGFSLASDTTMVADVTAYGTSRRSQYIGKFRGSPQDWTIKSFGSV